MSIHLPSSMKTLLLSIHAGDTDSSGFASAIESAAAILRNGGTVAFPTETVYGLGANALSEDAVRKIFLAKQRPRWDPLIVHVADREGLQDVVAVTTSSAQLLMDAFWPGPLTLLLPKADRIPSLVTAGRPLVGVRMPSHPVARALIRAAGVPIAAPSANSFKRISPTLATHVLEDLEGRIDAVIDAGQTAHGLESTVVGVSGEAPLIYRPGVITLEQIRTVCPGAMTYTTALLHSSSVPESLPSPGLDLRHYAPRAKLVLIDDDGAIQREAFAAAVADARAAGEVVGVMRPLEFTLNAAGVEPSYAWGSWSHPEELAQRLFAGLRELDAAGATVIVCPLPQGKGIGAAIRDRLLKGAHAKI